MKNRLRFVKTGIPLFKRSIRYLKTRIPLFQSEIRFLTTRIPLPQNWICFQKPGFAVVKQRTRYLTSLAQDILTFSTSAFGSKITNASSKAPKHYELCNPIKARCATMQDVCLCTHDYSMPRTSLILSQRNR